MGYTKSRYKVSSLVKVNCGRQSRLMCHFSTRASMHKLIILSLALLSCHPVNAQRAVPPELEARLERYFNEKEAQARSLVGLENQEQAPEMWEFFKAGKAGDWKSVGGI